MTFFEFHQNVVNLNKTSQD